MRFKNVFKESLISLAVLGMIGGSINANNVNARHRHYRTHRVYRHRARKVNYKFGYWKHHHYYRYKTGYFRNGKWIRKSRRKHQTSHKRYHITRRRNQRRRKSHKSYKHTWKIYRRNGTLAGVTHNYKTYVNTKRVIDMFYESKKEPTFIVDNSNTHANTKRNSQISQNENRTSRNDNHKSTNPEAIATNLEEFKKQTLTDINNDRQANGLSPLTEAPELAQLANTRANQIETNYNHVGGDYAENIDENSLGKIIHPDGSIAYNHNGYDMANTSEDDMINHDEDCNNGHRNNILDPDESNIGVGVSYSQNQANEYPYKLVEDFQ